MHTASSLVLGNQINEGQKRAVRQVSIITIRQWFLVVSGGVTKQTGGVRQQQTIHKKFIRTLWW